MSKKVLISASVQSHIIQFHRPLARVLHEMGYELHVAARNNLAEKNGLTLDFADKVFDVPFSRSPRSADNLRAYKHMKAIIDADEYEIIHCNTPMASIVTRLAARDARKRGTKVFYTAHGFHFYEGAPRINWIVYYPIEKFFARFFTDQLIVITEEDRLLACNRFQCPVRRIHGVGALSERYRLFSPEEQEWMKAGLGLSRRKIIINVGELRPNKNQTTVIRAMKEVSRRYPDALLLIAGNGPDQERLLQLIGQEGLADSVRMLGYTTELYKYVRCCDVLVTCSHREGMPQNVIEAMMCGKPVVASDNRGHRELVQEGINGYIVSADDPGQVASRLCDVLSELVLWKDRTLEISKSIQLYTDTNVQKELEEIYDMTGR